ncbi:IclR family transcriptional regulator [Dactylosporangium fulvum]|uniref:IclR family transcriptional regulator n=1 Tax=Dactylosporangium fulvum TaxID=53359 RepID=A0ABY5VQS4_9ACTN|nr:IclR family transcriptional regulator [Dactylosporangium fulvum]UWP80078.1 IclR family transcriptional regulator [Dactylosporangium fulvum]
MRSQPDQSNESVLQRANALLGAFGPRHRHLTLSAIVMRTGLPKSTVHRTAKQMMELGWLTYEHGRYALGTRIFELAGHSSMRYELRETALPYMEDLYESTHVSVHLAVHKDLDVLYVEKIRGHDRITDLSQVGGRMPLYCTGLGKVLLAFSPVDLFDRVISHGLVSRTQATITSPIRLRRELQTIAANGFAFDREEASVGINCVAAPIFGHDRKVVAAISVTGRATRTRMDALAPAVTTAAHGISRTLGAGRMSLGLAT